MSRDMSVNVTCHKMPFTGGVTIPRFWPQIIPPKHLHPPPDGSSGHLYAMPYSLCSHEEDMGEKTRCPHSAAMPAGTRLVKQSALLCPALLHLDATRNAALVHPKHSFLKWWYNSKSSSDPFFLFGIGIACNTGVTCSTSRIYTRFHLHLSLSCDAIAGYVIARVSSPPRVTTGSEVSKVAEKASYHTFQIVIM